MVNYGLIFKQVFSKIIDHYVRMNRYQYSTDYGFKLNDIMNFKSEASRTTYFRILSQLCDQNILVKDKRTYKLHSEFSEFLKLNLVVKKEDYY